MGVVVVNSFLEMGAFCAAVPVEKFPAHTGRHFAFTTSFQARDVSAYAFQQLNSRHHSVNQELRCRMTYWIAVWSSVSITVAGFSTVLGLKSETSNSKINPLDSCVRRLPNALFTAGRRRCIVELSLADRGAKMITNRVFWQPIYISCEPPS